MQASRTCATAHLAGHNQNLLMVASAALGGIESVRVGAQNRALARDLDDLAPDLYAGFGFPRVGSLRAVLHLGNSRASYRLPRELDQGG